jgi:formate/nitrite transporter FocA (FNT family)
MSTDLQETVLCRLHHVVAGVFAGEGVTLEDYGHFLLWTTLGNAVGGSFFVAVIKYSYAIGGRMPA